jgi:hypothetical protein
MGDRIKGLICSGSDYRIVTKATSSADKMLQDQLDGEVAQVILIGRTDLHG